MQEHIILMYILDLHFTRNLNESLVAVGLSPLEALKTSVINGPKWMGVEENYGAIANGKKADILLLKKNPLINITNTTSIQAVIKNGRYLKKN